MLRKFEGAYGLGALTLWTAALWCSSALAQAEPPADSPAVVDPASGVADTSPAPWSFSGFLRYDSAFKTSSDENIVNQRGNPFNGVSVERDSTFYGGAPDSVTRAGKTANNDFNLNQVLGQLDLAMDMSPKLRLFARLRGVYDLGTYDEFDPDDSGSNAFGFNYQKPQYFEYDEVGSGGSQNRLEWAGRRGMVDFPSLYVDYNQGPLLLRVGQQQIAWGQALFFRVLDVPNGLDLRRHLFLDYAPEEYADERVASPGVRLTYQLTQSMEMDWFGQMFQPTIYPNANTPYNAIASQFTVQDRYSEDYEHKWNTGLRLRGQWGAWSSQFIAVRRYNPDGVFRWTKSGVNRDLGKAPGTGALLAETAFEVDSTGVVSADEWFTYAGNARLNGVTGLNASIRDFQAAQDLQAFEVSDMQTAARELNLFFFLADDPATAAPEGLRGHIERRYFRETNLGAGVGYVFSAAPGSLLDQLIVNLEATYTPGRMFTDQSLRKEFIEDDEVIGALVMEKYQRFSQEFPATYMVFQWMHRTQSDLFGRHLDGMGGSRTGISTGIGGGWNGLVFAVQQPSPTLTWRFDGAILYDTRGGLLFQPALAWKPNTDVTVQVFYNLLDGDIGSADPNTNIIQTLDYADELGLRIGYQF